MRISDVVRLTDEGIVIELEALDKQEARALHYGELSENHAGKLLLQDLKDRINTIRSLYAAIPPAAPEAPILFAALQAQEWEVGQWVDRLGSYDKLRGAISDKRERLVKEMETRRKRRENRENTYIPTKPIETIGGSK